MALSFSLNVFLERSDQNVMVTKCISHFGAKSGYSSTVCWLPKGEGREIKDVFEKVRLASFDIYWCQANEAETKGNCVD